LQLNSADLISDFIKSLLEIPSNTTLESSPIQLDQPKAIVRAFVLHLYSDAPAVLDLTTAICQGVFELCDRFAAPRIHALFTQTIQTRIQNGAKFVDLDVWEIFKLAAFRDEADLAEAALSVLDAYDLKEILFTSDRKSFDRLDGLPSRYLYSLMMAKYKSERRITNGASEYVGVPLDSKGIATAFALNYAKLK
jgi:hypothetical protein